MAFDLMQVVGAARMRILQASSSGGQWPLRDACLQKANMSDGCTSIAKTRHMKLDASALLGLPMAMQQRVDAEHPGGRH